MRPMAIAPRIVAALIAPCLLLGCPRAGEEELRKANVYFATGDHDRALELYTTAAKLDEKSSRAREGAGNVHYERGALADAKRWYGEAIQANANAVTSRHKLALTLAAMKDFDGALKALEGALEVAPDNPYALSTMGAIYRKMGRLEDAEAKQLEALRLDPDYHGARYALANLMIGSGRNADAERQLSLLATSGMAELAEYGFARISATKGDVDDVVERLGGLLERGVDAPERIAADPVFEKLWGDPKMASLRAKLGVATSTSAR